MIIRMIKTAAITIALFTSKTVFAMHVFQSDTLNISNVTHPFPGCRNFSSNDWCNAQAGLEPDSLNSTQLLECYKDQHCKTGVLTGLLVGDLFMGIFGTILMALACTKINKKCLKIVVTTFGSTLFSAGFPGALSGFFLLLGNGENLDAPPPLAASIQKTAEYVSIGGGLIGFTGTSCCFLGRAIKNKRRNVVVYPRAIALHPQPLGRGY